MAIPLTVRLFAIFVGGLFLGGQLNRGIYRLAWNPRLIGPWSPPHPDAVSRGWIDRLPLVGWIRLRRESPLHGRGYWLRPLLIELATGLGLAALYWYEVEKAGVFQLAGFRPDLITLHSQYLAHVILISLMLVATFIDFDEQTIPDAITVCGTLIGLTLAAALPQSLPLATYFANVGWSLGHLHVAAPSPWPASLDGVRGLVLGLSCFIAWWVAIIPWTWTTRRGLWKALVYLAASFTRRLHPLLVAIAVAGIAGITLVWLIGGGANWESLLSSLVGMAFGGGLIWAVRIIGSRALGQEAMGFGDVTLMAMIGTFTGWQATLIIFFLAPFAAVFISVTQWLLTRRKDIAFGPYLCLAALYLLVRWGSIWNESARQVYGMGWLIPAMVAVCLVLMGGMLWLLRLFREWRGQFDEGAEDEDEQQIAPTPTDGPTGQDASPVAPTSPMPSPPSE